MSKSVSKRKIQPLMSRPFGGLFPRSFFDDMFDQFLTDNPESFRDVMKASMDVAETDQAFEVTLDLPGVDAKDVDISIDNNTLTIRGERQQSSEEEDKDKQFHRIERFSGSFARSIVLPSPVNEEEAAAEFKDGVLKIVIPKPENAKPTRINIST